MTVRIIRLLQRNKYRHQLGKVNWWIQIKFYVQVYVLFTIWCIDSISESDFKSLFLKLEINFRNL